MGKEHPASYVMELKRSWRVIVPLRGRLEPRICQEKFTCKADATAWMGSDEGIRTIALLRGEAIKPLDDGAHASAPGLIHVMTSPEAA